MTKHNIYKGSVGFTLINNKKFRLMQVPALWADFILMAFDDVEKADQNIKDQIAEFEQRMENNLAEKKKLSEVVP